MQEGFVKRYKRDYYMQQLRALGVNRVSDKALQECSDKELKWALALVRATAQ